MGTTTMAKTINTFIFVVGVIFSGTVDMFVPSDHPETKLHQEIFTNYNRDIRPVIDYYRPLIVGHNLHLTNLHEIDPKTQTLKTTVVIDLYWHDELLAWNETDYSDVFVTYIPQQKIWVPDYCVHNDVTNDKCMDDSHNTQVVLYSDGSVDWHLHKELTTYCEVKVTKFPFDNQECKFTVGFWYSDDGRVYMEPVRDGVETIEYKPNGEWEFDGSYIRKTTLNVGANHTLFHYYILIHRRPLYYIQSLVIPVVILSFLDMTCFLLPIASESEKLGIAMSIFLTFTVFLSVATSMTPPSSTSTFVFGVYLMFQLTISGLVILVEVFVVSLHHSEAKKINPIYLRISTFCSRCRNRKLHPNSPYKEQSDDHAPTQVEHAFERNLQSEEKCDISWSEIAEAVEKVLALIVVILNVLSILTFLLYVLT